MMTLGPLRKTYVFQKDRRKTESGTKLVLPAALQHQGDGRMKYIIAVVKPHKLDEVREALAGIGIQGVTVTEVKGHGRQGGHTEFYRGAEYAVTFVPKVKIEVAVDSTLAPRVVEAIRKSGETGQIGDGKIFVLPLEQAVRIRTGETGNDAL
jgi:nitrogen regulatory protein P-II 2